MTWEKGTLTGRMALHQLTMHGDTAQTYVPWLLGVSPLCNGWHSFGQEMSVIIGNLLDGINTTDETRQFCSVNVLGDCH